MILRVTWAEVIPKLKAAGFVEVKTGKGSHLLLKHPMTGKEIWVAVHTKKDAGRLGNRILREAVSNDSPLPDCVRDRSARRRVRLRARPAGVCRR
jgi:predicted RNA binding protein YcfA (HicA-like mRNA interferase family)